VWRIAGKPKTQHLSDLVLSSLVDSRLDAAVARRAEAHLSICNECSRRLATLQQATHLFRGLPDVVPLRHFSLAGALNAPRAAAPAPWRYGLGVAAAAVAALVVVTVTDWTLISRTQTTQLPPVPAATEGPRPLITQGPAPTPLTGESPEAVPSARSTFILIPQEDAPSIAPEAAAPARDLTWWPVELALAASAALSFFVSILLRRRALRR
jgi:hypothetical protein